MGCDVKQWHAVEEQPPPCEREKESERVDEVMGGGLGIWLSWSTGKLMLG